MGLCVDVITAENLVSLITTNIESAFPVINRGVKGVCEEVASRAKNDKIRVLRIWAHGVLGVKDGRIDISGDELTHDSVKKFVPTLSQLTQYFAPAARAELRSCQIAVGRGIDVMKTLAKTWNIEVYGAKESQFLVTWQGPVFVATPGGDSFPKLSADVFEEKCAR